MKKELNGNVIAIVVVVAAVGIIVAAYMKWGRGASAVSANATEQAGRAKMESQMKDIYSRQRGGMGGRPGQGGPQPGGMMGGAQPGGMMGGAQPGGR